MSKADLIFGSIKEFLLSKTLDAQEAEIINQCDCMATCFSLFDGLISNIYKTLEQVNADLEGTLAEARDFAMKAMASWCLLGLSITLKAHISKQHICN